MRLNRGSIFRTALISLIFAGLTLGMTFPVITKMTAETAGSGSDLYQTVADIITAKEQIAGLGTFGAVRDFFIHLRLDSISLNAYFSIIFGFPLGYNLFWLFSFLMSGLGAYFLARTLLKEYSPGFQAIPYVSFFTGIVYAFTPAHFYWANGFRGATHTEWIPWTILLLHLLLKRPSVARLIGTLVFAVLLFKGEHHFAAFFILFLIPYLWFCRKNVLAIFRHPRFRWYAITGLAICLAVLIASYSSLIKISVSDNNYLDPGIDQAITYSNDFLGIITPAYNQVLLGNTFSKVRETFTGNEFKSPSYLGILGLGLAGFALWRRKSNVGRFWLLIGCGFFILSLGPILHLAGIIEPRIPLPYILIYKFIPFFDNIRTVNRLIIFAVLGFSLAGGFGLLRIIELKVRNPVWQRLIPIMLGGVILLEYFVAPVPTTALRHSPFYDWLRNESGAYQVLEIPSATSYDASSLSVYYQRIHNKPLVNVNQFGRENTADPQYQRNITVPILNELLYKLPHNTALISHTAIDISDTKINTATLNKYQVRYLTLSKQSVGAGQEQITLTDFVGIQNFIQNRISTEKIYEDTDLIAYRVLAGIAEVPLLTLGSGWRKPTLTQKQAFQRIINPAILNIDSPSETGSLALQFTAKTNPDLFRTFTVKINETMAGQYAVTPTPELFKINLPNIRQGLNKITFTVMDKNGNPLAEGSKTMAVTEIRAIDNGATR